MLLFWVVTGVLAAAAAGLILVRAAGASARLDASDPAAFLYRRQLSEIDDLAHRGLMAESEREGAHAEAARRLLGATDAPLAPWNADLGARRLILAAAIVAPAVALGLYMKLGWAGLPDQPYAARLQTWRTSDLNTLGAPEIAAVLRDATRQRPSEAEGFRLLGLAEGASQNPAAAVRALRRAATLAPGRADIWRMLGQAEIVVAEGKVSAPARAAFERALALEPGDPAARFFLAQARQDAGDAAGAQADLRALLADLPQGVEGRAEVEAALVRMEGKPPPAVDPDQLAAIRGMVDSLAGKLKADPDDVAGWVRLVRAYAVLGDTTRRDEAYASARARYAEAPQILQQLDEAARAEPMR